MRSFKQKSTTPRMLIITGVFEEKSMPALQSKNPPLQECLELLSCLDDYDDNKSRREITHFLILSMAGTTATFWGPSDEGQTSRTSQSELFRVPQQHSESTKWRKWTALGFYCRTRGRLCEAKRTHANQLVRFTARTPWFVPHLLGEIWRFLKSVDPTKRQPVQECL